MMKQTKKNRSDTLFLCILFTLCMVVLSACGKSKGQEDSSGNDISIATLQQKMLEADTTLPELVIVSGSDEQAELNFSYLSDLDYDLVENYFYAYAKEGTAEEIAVIQLKDKGDAAVMMDSLHSHITQRQGTFREYAPEQVEMTEHAIVTREGTYVALIISSKNGLVQKAFNSCFEQEA